MAKNKFSLEAAYHVTRHNITKAIMSPDQYLPNTAIQLSIATCIATVAIVVNVYIIIFIARKKSSRTVKNDCYGYYLLHMFVVEISMSILSIPFTVVYNSLKWNDLFYTFYKVASIMKMFGTSLCIGTSTLMVLQRLLGANKSLRKKKAKRNLKWSLVLVWAWSLANTVPLHYTFKRIPLDAIRKSDVNLYAMQHPISRDHVYFPVLLCSLFVLPFLVTLFCCARLLRLHKDGSALMLKRRKQYQTFACMTLLLTVSFISSTLPEYLFTTENFINTKTVSFVVTLSWLYLVLHPVIYYMKIVRFTKPEKISAQNGGRRMSVVGIIPEQKRSSETSHLMPSTAESHEQRRMSIFERRKSSAVSAADVDAVLKKFCKNFSDQNGLDFHSLNSCISHLDNLNKPRKKVSLAERIRKLGNISGGGSSLSMASDEADCSTSLLPLPYPRVVHKLKQKDIIE